MKNESQEISREDQQIPAGKPENSRKPYCKPQLIELGDLRSITLGLSPTGYMDSGTGGLWEKYP